ncbi:MAG: PBP1A family penicillin-binding protein [Pseudomonadales bacterium]|nr:PBP1A family penicillin-binding protein [Pseudomonadales bacterium]
MPLLKRLGRYTLWCALTGASGAAVIGASAFLYLSPKLPAAESYRSIRLENPLRIFSSDNRLIAEFGDKKREPIKYSEVPPLLIDALIASEDSRFYSHHGVDLRSLARSVLGILTGNDSGGGSTITMQVAKNISFEGEDPYSRKFKEILLALQIERELNKEEIIELYLNRIFFGISAYGISAASRQYYDKPPSQLTLAEMAMTIGILPAPNTYNPLRAPEKALAVRHRVLRRMRELGMITQQQFTLADSSPITAKRYGRETELAAPYIAEMVRQEMLERYGDLAMVDGFEVYTTIDSKMQRTAKAAMIAGLERYDRNHGYRGRENRIPPQNGGSAKQWLDILARTPTVASQEPAFVQAVQERSFTALLRSGGTVTVDWDGMRWAKRHINQDSWRSSPRNAAEVVEVGDLIRVTRNGDGLWELGQVPDVNGALVAIDPNNGAIRSLVGGYDFNASKFNRATQAQRQPGSNFKPFLYSAALENGYTPASLINDAPLARSDYRPENFNGEFMGPLRLKYALTNSKNLVSLRLYDALGSDTVLPYVARFGFKEAEFPKNDLTVAIGSHAVFPLEIATGYSVFANGGYKVEPFLIQRIDNFNDGEVYRAQPPTVCADCTPATDETSFPVAPRVIDKRTAYIMNSILQSVITEGSGRPAARAIARQDLAGKTGTTNDANDLWFSGFNGALEATVYVGFDQPRSLGRNEQAATVALPIWIDYMKEVLAGTPEQTMARPDGLVTVRINRKTGLRTRPDDPQAIFEIFRSEDVPDYGNPEQGRNSSANPGDGSGPLDPIF